MIKKLLSSLNLTLRVLKNLILRPFRAVRNRVNYMFNAGRAVQKLPGVAKKLPKVLKTKPEKREDYFDWGAFYIAKSLVVLLVVLMIALPLLGVFVVAPQMVRWFGVKDFTVGDAKLENYSGRVCVYYDAEEQYLQFEGRLKKGLETKYGEEYDPNGRIAYAGEFVDGLYEGDGILYYEDGTVKYRGAFVAGRFEGAGEYTDEDGVTYVGTFEKGKISGNGTVIKDGTKWYEGYLDSGELCGEGKLLYPDGTVHYSGTFAAGALNGQGSEYDESGALRYYGAFVSGKYHGEGILYGENGTKRYAGAFEMGAYCGVGTLYGETGERVYEGEFEKGTFNGDGTLYTDAGYTIVGTFKDGAIKGVATCTYPNGLTYEGLFYGEMPSGSGMLNDLLGLFSYAGPFRDGDIDYGSLLLQDVVSVRTYFADLLSQKVKDDEFYLINTSYGIALRCLYAEGSRPACVLEAASKPMIEYVTTVRSAQDIVAPTAKSVGAVDATLPAWIAETFGIDAAGLTCYEAVYDTVAVRYWVNAQTGEIVLKSAASTSQDALAGLAGEEEELEELSDEELNALFDEIGLDPALFADFLS